MSLQEEAEKSQAELDAAQRARAFAAGFRCGQNAAAGALGAGHVMPPIVDWEAAEAANAVEHGMTMAAEFAP